MKRIHWLLASALVFALPACDDDDSDTQGSATDGDSSDSGGSDGSGGSGGSSGGSSDGSGGSSDGSGGSSDGSGGSSDSTSGGTSDSTSGGSTTDDSGGLKANGQPCQFADECQGDVCLFTDGDDVGLCSQVCEDWTDCPDFWDCVEVDNTAFKACFPGD